MKSLVPTEGSPFFWADPGSLMKSDFLITLPLTHSYSTSFNFPTLPR